MKRKSSLTLLKRKSRRLNSFDVRILGFAIIFLGFTEFIPGVGENRASAIDRSIATKELSAIPVNETTDGFDQVTSVSQLTDVKPTDWAFQALQSLVERYGCIVGFPDRTFRGNQALTRYEFAAGLNACLDRVSELIASSTANLVNKEDLLALQRLQEEFAAELAALRGWVDQLEVRTAILERQQFSTTTKLNGQVIFALAAPFAYSDRPLLKADLATTVPNNNKTVFSDVVQLTLSNSFTGKDRLSMQLLGYNAESFTISPIGFTYEPGGGGPPNNSVLIDNLFYSFPVSDWLTANIFASGAGPADIVTTTISPVHNSGQGAISGLSFPPQYQFNNPTTGSGASLNLKLGRNFIWDFGYLASVAPNRPVAGAGLFNGPYTLNSQINYLSNWLDISLYYANSYLNNTFGAPLLVGQAGYNPFLPGQTVAQISNIYATQFNLKFGKNAQFNVGGGVVFASIQGIGSRPDYDAWSYQGTFAWNVPNGSQLGLLAGVPPYTRDLKGQSTDTGFITELYYRHKVNDNLSITPSIIRQVNPYNVNSNPGAWIGTLRTTFTF